MFYKLALLEESIIEETFYC